MPSTYNPTRAIVSSTDATPIVLNVPGHNLTTGQSVVVAGHLTNVHANCLTTITRIDGAHFSLDGTTATGAGAGGATGAIFVVPATATTVPSDGDGPGIKAADVNVPLEGFADAIAYLIGLKGQLKVVTFNASTTYHVPANVIAGVLFGCGGGGQGGGGSGGGTSSNYNNGGGGGGAAPFAIFPVALPAGTDVAVVIGAGGTGAGGGGPSATRGTNGADGTASTFANVYFPPGSGGSGGAINLGLTALQATLGGSPGVSLASDFMGVPPAQPGLVTFAASSLLLKKLQHQGGCGMTADITNILLASTGTGAQGAGGALGGNAGSPGTNGTTHPGGGRGGGGGGGFSLTQTQVGGNGGNGGNGNDAGAGTAGTAGAVGTANTGSGGGGGGGGGCGTSNGAGAAGGNGGSGFITLLYVAGPTQ